MKVQDAAKCRNLPAGFLGKIRQICIATPDYRKTVDAMLRVSIGPWTVHTFGPSTCSDLTYYGRPADHVFKSALADMPTVLWEVIQPISGANIYTDFLNQNGEGVHHLLFECEGISWNEKVQGLERAGYNCINRENGSVRRHMPISILIRRWVRSLRLSIFLPIGSGRNPR